MQFHGFGAAQRVVLCFMTFDIRTRLDIEDEHKTINSFCTLSKLVSRHY